MSLQTWKAVFYTESNPRYVTWREALEHSINKWIGLRPENLERHRVHSTSKYLLSDGRYTFPITSDTCMLCLKGCYHNGREDMCAGCPLYLSLDNTRCDYGDDSPYGIFLDSNDPEPMISALKAARSKAIEDLGTMNGWKEEPELYQLHEAYCNPHNVYERRLGNCYCEYTCEDCYITWRVDSSDC